ncbi:MAG TPA: copper chaperone PCu(A)C, partial [Pirellulales bacterium]
VRRAALIAVLALAAAPAFAAGSVSIENPWLRLIIKARPAAGYFTLKNAGDKPVTLVSASSPACGMLMLHQSKQVNGVETMRPVKSVSVPAHGTVGFEPGGYHLMCMQPQPSMQVGSSATVTLKFKDGQSLTQSFPVKGPGGK